LLVRRSIGLNSWQAAHNRGVNGDNVHTGDVRTATALYAYTLCGSGKNWNWQNAGTSENTSSVTVRWRLLLINFVAPAERTGMARVQTPTVRYAGDQRYGYQNGP